MAEMRRALFPLILGLLLAAPLPGPAPAQTADLLPDGTALLRADRITYTTGYRVLRASGNVEVVLGSLRLRARELIYDEKNDLITATGPLRITDGDRVTFAADFAELSGDLRDGILKSARMVLNRQLQIAAVEISRSEGRFNALERAVASACVVSTARPTPLWEIRAKRIVHNEAEQSLRFERAQFRLAGVPVAYIPRLRMPGPGVTRASGFLVPALASSNTLGLSLATPYFIRLGDYADLTLSPRLYGSGTATLGFRLRKRFAAGAINLNGAISRDTVNAQGLRAYLFADGFWRFRNGLKAELDVQLASDTRFLQEHGISDKQRLESRVALTRISRRALFSAEIEGFRTLSATVPGDTIPWLLGEVRAARRWQAAGGGRLALDLGLSSFSRRSSTDITGRDGMRLRGRAEWQREWALARGLVITTTAQAGASYYRISQDSTFPTPFLTSLPLLAADLRLPMQRARPGTSETLEPRLQIVWSNPSGTTPPNEDSQLVEFAATSLFALNRFSGDDRIERGLRANIGIGYSRRADSGLAVEALFGRVVRLADTGQFAAASGLSGSASSYVLAAQIALPKRFRLIQRTVFGGAFALTRNETRLIWKTRRFDMASSYLWLLNGAAGNSTDISDWSLEAGWDLGRNWRSETSFRYDLATGGASDAGLALTYRNECIKVDLSLSRRYVSSSNVSASTSLSLQVALEGFGSRAASDAYKRRCSEL